MLLPHGSLGTRGKKGDLMIQRTRKLAITIVAFYATLSGVFSFADDDAARAKLAEAKLQYAKRFDMAALDASHHSLALALEAVASPDLKFEVLVFDSRVLYAKGSKTVGDKNKIVVYAQALNQAAEAKAVNPNLAEAYFWYAANLGRWAEANGILASLKRKKELIENTEAVYDRETQDAKPGEDYEDRGADRILGRLYFKLPGFAGGSQEKALRYLSVAYEKGRQYALNVVYYAETLYAGGAADKDRARQILDELLSHDPAAYHPNRVPETLEEFDMARKLRSEMNR